MDVVLTFVDDQGAAQSKDVSPWDDGEVRRQGRDATLV